MLLFHLVLAVFAGCLGHVTYFITGSLPNGLSQITAYTLGVCFAFPFVRVAYDDLDDIQDSGTRLLAAYFLAYLAFGAGTALGWRIYTIPGPNVHIDDSPGLSH